MPKIPEISVGIRMERFVSFSSDRNIRDHLWRWSTYFGRNIPTDNSHFYWLAGFNRKMSFHFPQVFPLISDRSVWHNGKHPSNIPVRGNRNEPFHLISNRNIRNLWHNGKHPMFPQQCFLVNQALGDFPICRFVPSARPSQQAPILKIVEKKVGS